MSLKNKVPLPAEDQAVSAHAADRNIGSSAARQSSTIPFVERQSSLHAHPRQSHRSSPSINNRPFRLGNLSGTVSDRLGIELLKRRAGLNLRNTERSNTRRAEITSQGTVVVNHEARERRQNALNLHVDTAITDEIKSRAERSYYEQFDNSGSTRRRSMLRTVSKEDYLLGRGANPRTGLVTPGGGSIDSNIEGTPILRESNAAHPAKWRQKGDQWVSLDLSEPTPDEAPAIEHPTPPPKVRRARTPQRLMQWDSSVPNFMAPVRQSSTSKEHSPPIASRNEPEALESTASIPGSFPEVSQKQVMDNQAFKRVIEASIKRKPIGSSPSKEALVIKPAPEQCVRASDNPAHGNDSELRSCSVPARPYTPVNTTKQLPQLPNQGSSQDKRIQMERGTSEDRSFLEVRSKTLDSINQFCIDSPTLGWTGQEKEISCLPMSNGQYLQSRSSKKPVTQTSSQLPERLCIAKDCQQQQRVLSTTERTTSQRSHIVEMMIPPKQMHQINSTNWTANQNICAIPNYDNPPRNLMLRPSRPLLGGPRTMPQPLQSRAKGQGARHAFTDQFNTTSMSTGTSIPMTNIRGPKQPNGLRILPKLRSPPTRPVPPPPIQMVGNEDLRMQIAINATQESLVNWTPPHIAPRGMGRPHLPSRAIGMHQVPRMNEAGDMHLITPMDHLQRSSTTGMPSRDLLRSYAGNGRSHTHIPAVQSCPQAPSEERVVASTSNIDQMTNNYPMRRCSRCQIGMVASKPPNIDGQMDNEPPRRLSANSAHAPEVVGPVRLPTPISEVTEPSTSEHSSLSSAQSETTSATILNVQDDLRDHSMCCPDCCRMDCHEGCLGHLIAATSPVRNLMQSGKNLRQRADSVSTVESISGVSSTSRDSEEKRPKSSFMKSVFGLLFWNKRPSEGLKNENSPSKERESKTDRTFKSQVKASPPKMFDSVGGHNSAVAAAKKAIGFDQSDRSPENGHDQLIVPRKRPRTRDTISKVAFKEDESNNPVPLPSTSTVRLSNTANECRKISNSRPGSGNQSMAMLHPPQTRTISGASADSRIPSMDVVGSIKMSEFLFIVPFEATRMWLHNNPQVMGFGSSALDCGWAMGCEAAATARVLLNTTYVYSKTGKFKVKDASGNKMNSRELITDSIRSIFYLLILVSITVLLVRIIKIALLPLRLLVSIGRYLMIGGKHARFM